MTKYGNKSGKSNVLSFEMGDDYIIVEFGGPRPTASYKYLYTYSVAGKEEVEKMKRLALEGRGLGGMLASKPYHKHANKWEVANGGD